MVENKKFISADILTAITKPFWAVTLQRGTLVLVQFDTLIKFNEYLKQNGVTKPIARSIN